MISFYFNFISSGAGIKQIDEPFGFDSVPFGIKQDEGRKGRDVLYAGGGDAKFTIGNEVDRYGHSFDRFLADWERYGFEVEIEFMCDFGNGIEVIGNVADISSNQVDTIEFIVRQKNSEANFKRNFDVSTNPFSFTDIDGNPITPVTPERMLLKAKPIIQTSIWSNPTIGKQTVHDNPFVNADYFNLIKNQDESEIKNSLSWFLDYDTASGDGFKNFGYIEALTNLKNVNIQLNLNIIYDYLPQSGLDESGQVLIRIYWGTEDDYQMFNLWNSTPFTQETPQQQILPTSLSYIIPSVNRTEKVWIAFVSGTQNGAINRLTWNESTVKITATSVDVSTVIYAMRYWDVIKYAVKSASGLDAFSPRLDYGGQFYDQYITTTALIRGLIDKPFNISNKDIAEEHIQPEWNGDYEIDSNSDVFYGIYRDFFRNYECGAFEQQQFDGFDKNESEKAKKNIFKFEYKNYASQKESEQENTYDLVHGQTEWKLPNKQAEDAREASVGFIRDAFYLALEQRKSYNRTDTTATQDDDKKYLIDAVALPPNTSFIETFELQHNFDADADVLTLRNTGIFTFTQLGIVPLSTFQILSGENQGSYPVISVSEREIKLLTNNAEDVATENTTFKYFVDNTVKLTNRTNEGFQIIQGIADGNNYANLRFTAKRNIINYYSEELATACIFKQGQPIRNTVYKNNPDALTQITGEAIIKEGDNFVPTNPILDGWEYKMTLIMTLQEFWDMVTLIRSERGYIRTWDGAGNPIRVYISSGEWLAIPTNERSEPDELEGTFECTGLGKYEPYILEIFADGITVNINNEIIPSGFSYQIDEFGKVSLFDSTGKLLYNPVVYGRIKVNNAVLSSVAEANMILSQYDRY